MKLKRTASRAVRSHTADYSAQPEVESVAAARLTVLQLAYDMAVEAGAAGIASIVAVATNG